MGVWLLPGCFSSVKRCTFRCERKMPIPGDAYTGKNTRVCRSYFQLHNYKLPFWNQREREKGVKVKTTNATILRFLAQPDVFSRELTNIDCQTGEYLLAKYWQILTHYLLNQLKISQCLNIIKWNGLWKFNIKIWVKFPSPHLKKIGLLLLSVAPGCISRNWANTMKEVIYFRWQLSYAP